MAREASRATKKKDSAYVQKDKKVEVVKAVSKELKRRLSAGLLAASILITAPAFAAEGIASYYTAASCKREGTSGIWTASQERFDENALTCALPHRRFGGKYKVTNLDNGRSVVVRHNDLGPNKKLQKAGRIIDLSKGAFERIASTKKGLIRVRVEAL